jgi:hypothetical protein
MMLHFGRESVSYHGFVKTIKPYLDAFKYGAPPHAGGGIDLSVSLCCILMVISENISFLETPRDWNLSFAGYLCYKVVAILSLYIFIVWYPKNTEIACFKSSHIWPYSDH